MNDGTASDTFFLGISPKFRAKFRIRRLEFLGTGRGDAREFLNPKTKRTFILLRRKKQARGKKMQIDQRLMALPSSFLFPRRPLPISGRGGAGEEGGGGNTGFTFIHSNLSLSASQTWYTHALTPDTRSHKSPFFLLLRLPLLHTRDWVLGGLLSLSFFSLLFVSFLLLLLFFTFSLSPSQERRRGGGFA